MSIVNKIEAVLDKLATLQGGISDKYNQTHHILEKLSDFAKFGLNDLVNELEEIRDEVEENEHKIGQLEEKIEELEVEEAAPVVLMEEPLPF
ncbi:hypothetical protein AB4Z17_11740 [Paenibacillus sp. TAF43_2]|uniref:hypothetical protein n=1 Tax=Paenibacillus sp. TAF43_2 TaxID=3233069 RepID=UPI003F977230